MATALSAVPPFLVGSLTPAIREDIDIDTRRLGILVASYFLAGAVAAVPGGRLAERLGPRRALTVTGVVTTLSLASMALVVGSWFQLLVAIVVAGLANGMVHPAGNLAIMRGVPEDRRGAAFGIKQAAAPLATMFAGIALPVFVGTIGWRGAFLVAIILLPTVLVILPADFEMVGGRGAERPALIDRALVLTAVASALAFGAATTIGAFLVDGVVSDGGGTGTAGATLTAASIACIAVRIAIGWQTDRMDRPSIGVVAGLMAVGAGGLVILAVSPAGIWPIGAIVGMAAGWGWPGLLYHAVAANHPDAPAASTAVATTGNALGAAIGPLMFGIVASRFSFAAAWSSSAVAMGLAAAVMVAVTRIRDVSPAVT